MENASDDCPQPKKLKNLLPNFAGSSPPISPKTSPTSLWKLLVLKIFDNRNLAHQNRTIASALTEPNRQKSRRKKRLLSSEIAARNRRSLATFHRTLTSQCIIAFSCLGNRCDFFGPRWASQSQIAKIAAISVRDATGRWGKEHVTPP